VAPAGPRLQHRPDPAAQLDRALARCFDHARAVPLGGYRLELTARNEGSSTPPSAVVLFSDGQQTLGANEAVAVDVARRANVPVSTVAIGTVRGIVTLGSFKVPAPVDRPSLAAVAAATHGHAFVAHTGSELAVYETVAKGLGSTTDTRDYTGWLLAVALGFGAAALVAAFVWNQRVP